MKAAITYLLLIRHGENDWVGTHRLAGRTPGVHLNETGRAQSARLAEQLSRYPISAVYSSPLERCLETAQPLAHALGLPVREEPGVLEVDYGEWRGGDLKELAKTPEWHSFRFPGGETLHEVQTRAVWALERIVRNHPNQLVAVLSHGDVIRTSLAHFMGTPLDLFQRIQIGTASISALAFHDLRPTVLFTNYLADLPKFEWPREDGHAQGQADSEAHQAPAPQPVAQAASTQS
jgi:probable phosphomutase (TIGR03848 family)